MNYFSCMLSPLVFTSSKIWPKEGMNKMCRLKYYNLIFSTICALGVWANAGAAKADGDPSELVNPEVTVESVTAEQKGKLL